MILPESFIRQSGDSLSESVSYYDEETIIGISNDRSEMDEMVLGLTYFTMKTSQPGELKEYAILNSGEELSI